MSCTAETLSLHARSDLEQARDWILSLEKRRAQRSGKAHRQVRADFARETGIPASTLTNIVARRLKGIGSHYLARLRSAVIEDIKTEIGRLEHELAIAAHAAHHLDQAEVRAVEALIAQAREVLRQTADDEVRPPSR